MMLTIAHLSICGQVWHRRVSCGGPSSLSQGVRESNRGSIIAGHVGIRHWWVAITLICLAAQIIVKVIIIYTILLMHRTVLHFVSLSFRSLIDSCRRHPPGARADRCYDCPRSLLPPLRVRVIFPLSGLPYNHSVFLRR